ncbi:uncharacterized protein LOC133861026 [Alnus glutinosa]|uniref:uncharacterized protein LOC133861026 n=1 Tax=Alnus glutinosa TaxID=3517 RepID=UPI002D773AD5|nr:uncharacterized protein LOC133861026 [Alnus glutinosa]
MGVLLYKQTHRLNLEGLKAYLFGPKPDLSRGSYERTLNYIRDYMGRPLMTTTNDSNPWWSVFKQAITAVGGKLAKPEILVSTTDARYIRQLGIPALGFSPMTNTPILLHDHNEFLKDTVYLKGVEVYESIISSLSSFEEASH